MLPKDERLRKNKDFEKVFKKKYSVATSSLIAYVLPKRHDSEKNLPLVGFIVAKKVHKKATKRNKIKRRLRDAYRELRATNTEIVSSFDSIIFIARPLIQNHNFIQIHKNVQACIYKANKLIIKREC